jgi:hypothetical protein
MFKIQYKLNKMHSITLSHQAGWFDGKKVNIYAWGFKDQAS